MFGQRDALNTKILTGPGGRLLAFANIRRLTNVRLLHVLLRSSATQSS
jgi:hypothetical protein